MSDAKKKIRLALLGCGVVGGGVLQLLRQNQAQLRAHSGAELEVAYVLVRDAKKARPGLPDGAVLTDDPERVFADPSVDLVVEVMGGEQPALGYLTRAFEAGCSVVSANKLLIAKRGSELLGLARGKQVDFAFEAAVAGGVPLIRTLRDSLTSDRVRSVHALLNGTCNYILTEMREKGLDFDVVLKEAQKLGYAEAEPSLDVDGHDAVQKLAIVAMLAFGAKVDDESIFVEGIREVDAVDFEFAQRFGFSIKHVAVGIDHGARIELRAHPALVPAASPLAGINDVLNGAWMQGEALGPCLLVGRGAGALPTAVSVVADIVDLARARVGGASGLISAGGDLTERELVPLGELETRFYLRFEVNDEPGVLGALASALGRRQVSVKHMVQECAPAEADGGADKRSVSVLMITHTAKEQQVQEALAEIAKERFVAAPPRLIRIESV